VRSKTTGNAYKGSGTERSANHSSPSVSIPGAGAYDATLNVEVSPSPVKKYNKAKTTVKTQLESRVFSLQ